MQLLQPLTEEQKSVFLSEIGYSDEKLREDLIHIKEWLKLQEHFPPACLTEKDEFLEMYLTGCKGKLDKVKSKLDAYYTYRSQSEIFDTRDPTEPKYALVKELCYSALMPRATKKGIRIVNFTLSTSDSTNFDFTTLVRRQINLSELAIRLEGFSIGLYVVVDCQNVTMSHILKLRLRIIRDAMLMLQEILPFRVAGLYFFNTPYFVELAFNNMISPFLNKKIKNRVHITSKGFQELNKYLDVTLLSKDFGGNYSTLKELSNVWMQKEIQEREWYIKDLSQRTDESKRKNIDKSQHTGYFGFTSSIKTLFSAMTSPWSRVKEAK